MVAESGTIFGFYVVAYAYAMLAKFDTIALIQLIAAVTALIVAVVGFLRYRADREGAVDAGWVHRIEASQEVQEQSNALVRQDNVALRAQVAELRVELRDTREELTTTRDNLRSTEINLDNRSRELRTAQAEIAALAREIDLLKRKD